MEGIRAHSKLYIWKNSRMCLGINHQPFRNYTLAWSQLLVSIQGTIRLQLEDGSEVETRTCLIKAGSDVKETYINTRNAVIAIYYFNPISQEFYILQNQMLNARAEVYYQHPTEDLLVQKLLSILTKPLSTSETLSLVQGVIVPTHLRRTIVKEFDLRIIETVQNIRKSFRSKLSVSDYAKNVHLSESRLNKLFKDQIGIPITKYRLQFRLSVGVILLAARYSVTDAAYGAGFSSTAHFSKCFSDMIGVQPSTTFLKPPFVSSYICEEALKAIEPTFE
tara:strand:+ start:125 stop:958 length:834 start_codon:yes stop_codon:yes gene_type:complete